MSIYERDIRSGSAILIDRRKDKVVATFLIEHYKDFEEMRSACNNKWDELDAIERKKEMKPEEKNLVTGLELSRAYDGFFKMDVAKFDQKRFNGESMNGVVREVFLRKPVVFLSLFDKEEHVHLMTEQVRIGAIATDVVSGTTVIEPIAGIIDEGETPLEAAIREAKEETGIDIDLSSIKIVQKGFTTPGGSSEYAYFATGLFDSTKYTPKTGGVEGEQEDILTHLIPHHQAVNIMNNDDFDTSLSFGFAVMWHATNSI